VSCLFGHFRPRRHRPASTRSSPPPLSLSLSLSSVSPPCYLRALRHLFDSLKGIPVSICLFRFVPTSPAVPPPARLRRGIQRRSVSPRASPLSLSLSLSPSPASRCKLNNQFQSRENLFQIPNSPRPIRQGRGRTGCYCHVGMASRGAPRTIKRDNKSRQSARARAHSTCTRDACRLFVIQSSGDTGIIGG